MTSRLGFALGGLAGLIGVAILVAVTGSQVGDYPVFNKTKGPPRKIVQRKAYADLSDQEIRKVMKKMSAEIGAKCELCHNTKDYISFEKPTKEFAQFKMMMVQWLNAKYRPANATWEYSCYTCHRGHLKGLPSAPPMGGGPPSH